MAFITIQKILEMLRIYVVLFIVFGISSIPSSVSSQQEREISFVYGIAFYDGYLYGNALVPKNSDSIYLLANVQNVIAPRNTIIYYWPLTNHYLADWTAMNELVEGKLEILKNNTLVESIELQKYLVQYDSSAPLDTLKLFVGADADSAYERFKELQTQYRLDLRAYHDEMQAYRDEVNELLASEAAQNGTLSEEDFPARPEEIPGFTLHSQPVAEGFVLSLPAGKYIIQLRLPDGSIHENSRKILITFEKSQDGTAFNVVPESRWTRPEHTKDISGVVYTSKDATIYLAPFFQSQYNEYYYEHMLDPQNQSSRKDRKEWVAFSQLDNVSLKVESNGKHLLTLPLEGYKVQQLPGSALGYEVLQFDPEIHDTPSFEGFKISIEELRNNLEIQLLNEDGSSVIGSQRFVQVLYTDRAWIIYLFSLLPLIVGVSVSIERNRNIKKIKVKDDQSIIDL